MGHSIVLVGHLLIPKGHLLVFVGRSLDGYCGPRNGFRGPFDGSHELPCVPHELLSGLCRPLCGRNGLLSGLWGEFNGPKDSVDCPCYHSTVLVGNLIVPMGHPIVPTDHLVVHMGHSMVLKGHSTITYRSHSDPYGVMCVLF